MSERDADEERRSNGETEVEGSISPDKLAERLTSGDPVTILDTRDRDEFEAWHVDGPSVRGVQIPHARFIQAEVTGTVEELAAEHDIDNPVVVCARGQASDHAASLLRTVGVDAVNLQGGMDAWARVYRSEAVDVEDLDTDGLSVRQYVRPSSGCLAYLLYDETTAIVVDPLRVFADRYVDDARELDVEITAVVDTHVHADHVSGLRAVAERTAATSYVPENTVDRGLAFEADLLAPGDAVRVGNASVSPLHVPGHTSEMTALCVGDVTLTGDSLFLDSVARPDLEAGDEGAVDLAVQLYGSLHDRLLTLPDETLVAPGHVGPRTPSNDDGTYTAVLGELRDSLELLGHDREAFVSRVLSDIPPRPANDEEIIAVNLGLEEVDEETGFDLELGPNNCAVST